jgi:hypothetical protein
MPIDRRAFLAGLVSAFGMSDAKALTHRIEDSGRPLLLPVRSPSTRLHVYTGGVITYGPEDDGRGPRPTWRQLWEIEGIAVHDPVALLRTMTERSLDPEDLDRPIDNRCWPMAYATTWCPEARAHGLLRRLGVGSTLRGQGRIGRLEFNEGDNHPGSSDVWVQVTDNLSASLLQARLIELGQAIEIVMEVESIREIS